MCEIGTREQVAHMLDSYMMMMMMKYWAIVVGSLLMCKIKLVPLVSVTHFLKIDINQIISMIMDSYRC
jgi:hypothetical protein